MRYWTFHFPSGLARRLSFAGILVVAAWSRALAAEEVVLFEDSFEAKADQASPVVGGYEVFKAATVPLSELNSDAGGTAVSGRVLQLARSDKEATGSRRIVGRLTRPVTTGEQVRLEFDARIQHGSVLQFGLGSKAGGVAVGGGHFFTVLFSLSDKGRVSVYNGIGYERVPDLEVPQGQWQRYTLDFLVGSEEVTLKAGDGGAVVIGPFAEKVQPVASVEEIFFSIGSAEVVGEFDNVKVSIVDQNRLSALPVFGRIVWQREYMPFVKKGPKAGISGMGMCALGDRVFVAGGFLGKGKEGDGSLEPNRMTSKWVYAYDAKTRAWSRLPDLPARAEYGRMTTAGGKLYFVGGAAYTNAGDKVGLYTPSAATHVLDPDESLPEWRALPSLPEGRTHFALGHVGDRLIAVGGNVYDLAEKGYSARTIRGDTAVFDVSKPKESWQIKPARLSPPRGWAAAAACRGRLWVFGGVTFQDDSKTPHKRLRQTLSYDPVLDIWSEHALAPMEVSGWGAATYRDRYVILVGGYASFRGRKPRMNVTPLVYDTVEDRWLRLEQSATPTGGVFNDPGVAIIQDSIYVAGAEGPGGSHYNYWLTGRIEASN